MRACLASVTEKALDAVPRFADTAGSGALEEWLSAQGLAQIVIGLPPDLPEALRSLEAAAPRAFAMLLGRNDLDHHCVVTCGGSVVHDPAGTGSKGIPLPMKAGGYYAILLTGFARSGGIAAQLGAAHDD